MDVGADIGYYTMLFALKCGPLDELWPKLKWKHLDLVKIDTEGAEMSILKGMEKTIKEYPPHLLIEVHPKQLKEVFNSSAEEVMNLITKTYQYKLTPVDRETLDIPSKGNITVWADWIGGIVIQSIKQLN